MRNLKFVIDLIFIRRHRRRRCHRYSQRERKGFYSIKIASIKE